MQQFRQAFFDEALEGLDIMEAGLLGLDPNAPVDGEQINAIFRAAHSIKGGAGTFGFDPISRFTHTVETLLDEVRAGQRGLSAELTDALLRSVDALRAMLDTAQADANIDLADYQDVSDTLTALLDSAHAPGGDAGDDVTDEVPAPTTVAGAPGAGWRITFVPDTGLFATGNDPLHILRELSELGELHTEADTGELPALADMAVECCYLRWTLTLHTDASEARVREAFAWVEDDCELHIEPLGGAPAVAATDAAADSSADASAAAASNTAPAGGAQQPGTREAKRDAPARPTRSDGGSIRIATERIDALINLVGELVITQSMLKQVGEHLNGTEHEQLLAGLELLERNTRDIQEAVLATRMVPIDFVFSRFPRVVRDVSTTLGKQVNLVTDGEGTELDRGVIEKIVDPLTHIVRNSIDHGIETPAARTAAGKPEAGTITLSAAHEGGNIVIDIRDDGAGLSRERILAKARSVGLAVSDEMSDADVWQLLFAPGFSTAEAVTDLSGRGVGMDVVRRNIQALGGQVELTSTAGAGTRVTIRLPLTLAILDGMLVAVGEETYIIPLNAVAESMQPDSAMLKTIAGAQPVVRVRGDVLPLVALHAAFGVSGAATNPADSVLVIAEAEGRRVALQVDALVGHQQVVIKNLETNYRHVAGISGATILGSGRVALILDVSELARLPHQAAAA